MSDWDGAEALTLDQMRVLVAVTDTGSFSGAARQLKRSQSAISYQVANLEAQLDLTLFERTRRKPRLTDEGAAVLDAARNVLDSVEQLRARARAMGEGLEPRLVLAIDVLYPMELLAEHLAEFEEQYPSVDLDVRIGVREQPVKMLAEGDADVAVLPHPDRFEARACRQVELIAVAAPSHPLAEQKAPATDAQLAEHLHLVLADSDSAPAQARTWRLNDSAARLDLLRSGVGWSRLPRHQVADDLDAELLTRIRTRRDSKGAMKVPLYVAHTRGRALGPAARWWFDHL